VLRLLILSIVVGFIMVTFGIEPDQLVRNFAESIRRIFEALTYRGFDAVISLLRYCFYGAVIVVPIWLLSRLFARRRP
jgi:hypothetical protein